MSIRAVVLHVNAAPRASLSPTMRICRFVADELRLPFVHDEESAEDHGNEKYDVVFIRPGVLLFSPHRATVMKLIKKAELVVNLECDYAWPPDSRIRKNSKKLVTWGTIPEMCKASGGYYVNFNQIPFVEPTDQTNWPEKRTPGLFYYGKWREGRAEYLARWLRPGKGYPVIVSTFKESTYKLPKGVEFIRPLKNTHDLRNYQLTFYAEDKESHTLYCSPAQRFYECLLNRLPMVFEEHAVGTLKQGGFDVSDFVMDSYHDIKKALSASTLIEKEQRRTWRKPFRAILETQLHRAVIHQFGTKAKFKEI